MFDDIKLGAPVMSETPDMSDFIEDSPKELRPSSVLPKSSCNKKLVYY